MTKPAVPPLPPGRLWFRTCHDRWFPMETADPARMRAHLLAQGVPVHIGDKPPQQEKQEKRK